MGGGGGSKGGGAPQPVFKPQPEPAAKENAVAKRKKRPTILTGGQGVGGDANTAGKKGLLGE